MTQPHVTRQDIEHRFGYHQATFPKGYDPRTTDVPLAHYTGTLDDAGNIASAPRHAEVRALFIETAMKIIELTGPPSREQSLALTALQEAAMWTNACIAMDSPLVKE